MIAEEDRYTDAIQMKRDLEVLVAPQADTANIEEEQQQEEEVVKFIQS